MKKKLNIEIILKIVLMVYFIISPIFDLVFLYNHVTTLIRVSFIMIILIAVIIVYKDSRKSFWYLVAYYLALLLYLIIDFCHSKGFISLVPGNFNYNIISEAMTLVKLAMPFTIIFLLRYTRFSKKDFFKVINCWSLIIAGSIVICNICGYSLSSYSGEITQVRIFDWGKDISVLSSATKGFFSYANQEAIVLLILLVLSIYETFEDKKRYILFILLVGLALLMIGTRISSLGGLAVLIFMTLSFCIYSLLFKRKDFFKSFMVLPIIVGWLWILPIAPNSDRMTAMENAKNDYAFNDAVGIGSLPEDVVEQNDLEYIDENFNAIIFNRDFYKTFYPYTYDTEFWIEIVDKKDKGPTNYREMEIAITKRIWEIDGRRSNYLFGLSNSRIQNVVNVEMDFVLHFFAFGILGMIIVLLFYPVCCINLIKNLLKEKDFLSFSILVCFGLVVLASFLSGNSLNFLAVIVPSSFVFGYMLECSYRRINR